MSLAVRTEIATAAAAGTGLRVTTYFRQTTKPGDAFVRLERWTRDSTGFGFMATWALVVVVPQDLEAAEKYLDANLETIVTATAEALIITNVTPARLALDTGTLPVVMIEGTRAV